jgi:hypothetical protein
MTTNCIVNLGPHNAKIMQLAQVKYPHYVREQKLNELQNKNLKTNAVVGWENQLKSGPLARFLRKKDAEDYKNGLN